MPGLENRVALITGAGDGMGRAHALLMSERGADVIVADINEKMAQQTAEMVRHNGRRAHVEVVDMGDESAVKGMAQRAAEAHRQLPDRDAHVRLSARPAIICGSCSRRSWTRRRRGCC